MWHEWIFAPESEAVTDVLKRLPQEYVVVKDVVVPDSRVAFDYIVAGPSGLFAVETKDWTGDVKCSGDDWFVGRKRVPSPGRPAQIKAAALRKALVNMTYDGERTIPAGRGGADFHRSGCHGQRLHAFGACYAGQRAAVVHCSL
jgi:hypothetical protein